MAWLLWISSLMAFICSMVSLSCSAAVKALRSWGVVDASMARWMSAFSSAAGCSASDAAMALRSSSSSLPAAIVVVSTARWSSGGGSQQHVAAKEMPKSTRLVAVALLFSQRR